MESIDLLTEIDKIQQCIGFVQLGLVLLRDVRASQHSGAGGLRCLIAFLDLAPGARFLRELDDGQEEV